jgi:hypothetical protein
MGFADPVTESQMAGADPVAHPNPAWQLERGHLIGRHWPKSIDNFFNGT